MKKISNTVQSMKSFQNALAYFARVVSYDCKMLMKLTPGSVPKNKLQGKITLQNGIFLLRRVNFQNTIAKFFILKMRVK